MVGLSRFWRLQRWDPARRRAKEALYYPKTPAAASDKGAKAGFRPLPAKTSPFGPFQGAFP